MAVTHRCLALAGAVLVLAFLSTDAATAGRNPARPATAQKPAAALNAKDAKKKGMDHPAFAEAGTHKGIELWRIEDFEPVLVPRAELGKFYSGDSYIILNSKEDARGRLSWDLHYWLGSKTTQDESGAAAILTVALDDKLGGGPVQHREVQGHESPLFLGYFKPAIRYLDGGHASGFTHVQTNAGSDKRMFQVKGKKNIRVRQVEPSVSSMNKGDCFILDVEHDIFVYVGPSAKRVEKLKAISAANQIRDQDHSGRARIEIIDEFSSNGDFDKFFTALGSGSKDTVPEESAGGDDQEFERTEEQTVSLYRITDESGKLEAKPVAQKPFRQDHLNENDCFVLDTVTGGIYVWVGKSCNARERAEVMARAQDYLVKKNYPDWVHVTRVPQGTEPAAFKQYFASWRDHGASHSRLIRSTSDEEMYDSDAEVAAAKIKKVVKSGSARGFMPDKGDGHAVVYRVEDMELVEVGDSSEPDRSDENGAKYGQFYQGDSYVIKYEYDSAGGSSGYVLYFWLGRDSTIDEKAAAAMQVVALDNELGGAAVQIRVPQGEETKHFLKIFKGRLITHLGGHGSGFKSLNQKDSYDTDGVRLFKIEGSEKEDDMRAEQVLEESSSLTHDDAFLLETPDQIYAWIGKDSSEDEKDALGDFATNLFGDREVETLQEGEETEEFWNALGGPAEEVKESSTTRQKMRLRVGREPHLVQINVDFRNQVKLQEIGGYTQEDLDDDEAFLMDSGEEIYAWLGNQATKRERQSVQTAITEYLKTDPSDRTPENVVVVYVKQGHEPTIFKRMFDEWDADMWNKQISYDDMKSRILEQNEIL